MAELLKRGHDFYLVGYDFQLDNNNYPVLYQCAQNHFIRSPIPYHKLTSYTRTPYPNNISPLFDINKYNSYTTKDVIHMLFHVISFV